MTEGACLWTGPPPPSCFAPVEGKRSPDRFVASRLGIKAWSEATPSCAAARPGVCPCCEAAAQPLGGPLVVVGHGVVERQVLGPRVAGGDPVQAVVKLRRYRCRACGAVLVVGPRGLVRGRWYGAGAIGQALALYARGATSAVVRGRTSPSRVVGSSARERWVTLTRWVEAARRGDLFGVLVRPVGLGRRGVAEQVMLALAARAGHVLGAALSESAFAGALIAA